LYDDFKVYLEDAINDNTMRILVVLEDLPVRFVCLVGSRLRIHPTIFARQFSAAETSLISENITTLPSVEQTSTSDGLEYESDDEALHDPVKKRSFTLQYPVVMPHVSARQHPDPKQCPPWLKPDERLTGRSAYAQFIAERVLHKASKHDQWDTRGDVSELEGQLTYWYRSLTQGGYHGKHLYKWTESPRANPDLHLALFLVDPCLKDPEHLALIEGKVRHNTNRIVRYPELEDHEKLDISESPSQWHPSATFTKYILHDDILTHFSVADTCPGRNPLTITTFVRGFAVSKWTVQLNHIRRSYTHCRATLFSNSEQGRNRSFHTKSSPEPVKQTANWGAHWKEWIFDSMAWYITDLSVNKQDIEANMRALGIDIEDTNSYGLIGKREAQMWRLIHAHCADLQDMFQQLTTLYTQVVALRKARASNAQAKSVKWLTMLGTFFVPLSVVAGIMSMGADFLPGQNKFWVYFAVVGPLLLVMSLSFGLVTRWRGQDGS
jgi:hypothetical protein